MPRREWDKAKAASHITPLDFMLKVMWDDKQAKDLRFEAAKAAAPYVHAKLASISDSEHYRLPAVFLIPGESK